MQKTRKSQKLLQVRYRAPHHSSLGKLRLETQDEKEAQRAIEWLRGNHPYSKYECWIEEA